MPSTAVPMPLLIDYAYNLLKADSIAFWVACRVYRKLKVSYRVNIPLSTLLKGAPWDALRSI